MQQSQRDGPHDTMKNMNVRSRCLLILCGQSSAALPCFCCASALCETQRTARTQRRRRRFVRKRRKWLPREKVMPGKPRGDDGDAHAADQSEGSPLRFVRLFPSCGLELPCHPGVSAGHSREQFYE
ncbi:hypothetical protein CRENBAI_007473 [Crenichthys baileyi]|uniref:Secreted protein n=1 Tax=Crenichthys baileyi TaxID=28760 RepID=A0AAV9RUY4_9TELE